MERVPSPHARPVRLLAAGGTIAMAGTHAVPQLDGAALVEAIPALRDFPGLRTENVLSLPGPQISPAEALELARRAHAVASAGAGVVISTGTDTLEELAMLCALTYGGEAPIVFTGANRPASAPGADGPANLLDAVSLAAAPAHRVDILTATLGDDGSPLAAAARAADGLVVSAFGAGHVTPGMLAAIRIAIQRIPVVLTCRPERGAMLHATYGFEGSERDLRAGGVIPAPFLAAPAARIALMCCLGAGLDRDGIARALAPWDA